MKPVKSRVEFGNNSNPNFTIHLTCNEYKYPTNNDHDDLHITI